jgi:hypothetical protein
MAEEDGADALIGRTDALLKKHRPRPSFAGSPAPALDIPVLTEIVEPDAVPRPGPAADVGDGTFAQVDVEALALRLHEDVLRSLQPQIESLLDARLAQTLADLLEQVLRGMEAELKISLRAMVRDAVAAAIDREVLRITAPERGSGSEPAS